MTSELNVQCRTCLSESSTYRQLHDYVEDNYKILEMLDGIVPQIDIKTASKFSTLMCQSCVDKLLTSYKFQQLCIESNNRWHNLLGIAHISTEHLTVEPNLAMKQEIEDQVSSDCNDVLNVLELDMPTKIELERNPDVTGGCETDSSDGSERLSVLKERFAEEIPLKVEHSENYDDQNMASVKKTVCSICDKDFRYNSRLTEHMRIHTGEAPFPCSKCGRKFRTLRNMKSHFRIHSGEKCYACPQCGKKFCNPSNLRHHIIRHSNFKKYKCPVCPSRFYEKYQLKKHLLSEKVHLKYLNYKNRPNKLKKDCNEMYGKQALELHRLNDNEGDTNRLHEETDGASKAVMKEDIGNTSQLFKESVDNSNDAAVRNSIHNKLASEHTLLPNKIENNEFVVTGIDEAELKTGYTCETCCKVFDRASFLKRHSSVHSPMKPYECEICKYRFGSKLVLKIHLSKHENGTVKNYRHRLNAKQIAEVVNHIAKEKIDSTSQLFEEFTDISEDAVVTNAHVNPDVGSEHTPELPNSVANKIANVDFVDADMDGAEKKAGYPCETCCKVFDRISCLKRHSSVHSLMRPYECEICKYRFGSKLVLKIHLSKHKNGTVKNYRHRVKAKVKPVCEICEKEFSSNYNLKEHMRLHSGEKPYQCTQCGKAFRYLSAMKEHMRTHSGECPYECLQCGQIFRHSSSFNRHKERHMTLIKYYCSDCPRNFKCQTDLIKHKKNVHMKDENPESPLKHHSSEQEEIVCNTSLTSDNSLEAYMLTHRNCCIEQQNNKNEDGTNEAMDNVVVKEEREEDISQTFE